MLRHLTLPIGSWHPHDRAPESGEAALRRGLERLFDPLSLVALDGSVAAAVGGRAVLGERAQGPALPLLGHAPALLPEQLGDEAFRRTYAVRFAYVAGEMANGIASEALVEAIARAGMLAFFGAAGLTPARVEQAIVRLRKALGEISHGFNLIHSPNEPQLEAKIVELYLHHGVQIASASAYLDLTLPVVRYRTHGVHRDDSGRVIAPQRLMAKVSRAEVAARFLAPPPERFLKLLVESGDLSSEQAEMSRQIPMADDITVEADSGGHTDNRPLVLLLPAMQALRDEACARYSYRESPRIGAAGGIATPASAAAAFGMGAAYVMTGSVNQASLEAGTSDLVREMLAKAGPADVAMAPAADMFEMGVKVQVLSRGTLFPVRAAKLYELYRAHGSIAELPPATRAELERTYFRCTLEEAWRTCERFFAERDPAQLDRASQDPHHQLALLFRSYLGRSSKWANAGETDRQLDFQIWCGPAMGAFNEWTRGSFLESWRARSVVPIARNLMIGAAVLTRIAHFRALGVSLPPALSRFTPREDDALEALCRAPERSLASHDSSASAHSSPPAAEESSATSATDVAPARDEPIAIVGMGSLFPQAPGLTEFWRLLRNGEDAVTAVPPTHWSLSDYYDPDPKAPDKTYAARGAFLSPFPFDPTEFGLPPSILEATDTSQLLGLVAARMAMEDAGYGDGVEWDRSRASVILGVTGTQELVISLGSRLGHPHWRRALKEAGVEDRLAEDVVQRIARSYVGWQENSFPGLLGNVVAGRIANRLDFGGTNCVVDAACASSLGAVHLACLELRAGRADLVLSGGVDALNDIFMHMCFSKTPALSPTGDARPFSDRADGTVLGEGVGMLVLKRLSDAERDGDRVHAVIRAIGSSSDGRAKSIYAPLAKGQARALRAAYREARVKPTQIQLVEAHGTGTAAGDAAEFQALREVFRESASDGQWCALGSVKSQIGHTKAAAGAAGLIKASLALSNKVFPPTIKVEAPNPALDLERSPFYLSLQSRPWLARKGSPRVAAVSSFGFGGSNFHAVLEEYPRRRSEPAWDHSIELVSISSTSAEGILDGLARLSREGKAMAAETRAAFRGSDSHRLVLSISHAADPAQVAERARVAVKQSPERSFVAPDGLAYGVGPRRGKLAFLFPGQGAQSVGMHQELACVFPELREAVEAVDGIGDACWPPPTLAVEAREARQVALRRTEVAQPALGAVELGLLEVYRRFGVVPELVAGHSFGELVALHAAGRLSADSLRRVARMRGDLMAAANEQGGAMLAVRAPLEVIESLLRSEGWALVLANRNAPEQGVLSGSAAEIARAEATCKSRGLHASRLAVGAAFHSPLVAGAAQTFLSALQAIELTPPRVAVLSNSTADVYPDDVAAARAVLAEQLAKPVRFVEMVQRMHSLGARTFLEVGPRASLTGLVQSILGSENVDSIATEPSGGARGLADLAAALGRLAAAGHPVKLEAWQASVPPPRARSAARKPLMVVPLTGANYRAPAPAENKTIGVAQSRERSLKETVVVAAAPANPSPRNPQPESSVAQEPARETAAASPMEQPASAEFLQALRANQESIRALQALQHDTAATHQAFLQGQELALRSFHALLVGQQQLLGGSAAPMPLPLSAPDLTLPRTAALATRSAVEPSSSEEPQASAAPPPDAHGLTTNGQLKTPAAPKLANGTAHGAIQTPPAAPTGNSIDVVATLRTVVAEVTGYPLAMLQLDMSLEADLGIDSIKRVEILSLLSSRIPGAPSVDPEHVARLTTLRQVADFISGKMAPLASTRAPAALSAAAGPAAATPPSIDVVAELRTVIAEVTGYPLAMLQLDMSLEADLGIDSIKRVEILSLLSSRIPGAPSVDPEHVARLTTLRQVADFISGKMAVGPSANPPAPIAAVPLDSRAPAGVPIVQARESTIPAAHPAAQQGVAKASTLERLAVVAVALELPDPGTRMPLAQAAELLVVGGETEIADAVVRELGKLGHRGRRLAAGAPLPPGPLSGLLLLGEAISSREDSPLTQTVEAFRCLRAAGPRLRESGAAGGALLVSVARLDGTFGLASSGKLRLNLNPMQSGLSGLVKSAAQEWPEVRCRAIDLSTEFPPEEAAAKLVRELCSPGPLEVGLGPAGRIGLALRTAPHRSPGGGLQRGDLVVATGGARGVTAAACIALADRCGTPLLLLGRSPLPAEEPAWLREATDEIAIKRALAASDDRRLQMSPRALGDAARAVVAAREIRGTLARLDAAGHPALYRAVDVRDAAALATALKEARARFGPVRGLVHGAGVLRDRRIEDKSDEDVEQVLAPKLVGLENLLAGIPHDELRFLALFTSVSGRFGRRGQADYAAANQMLSTLALRESARRPACRVVALDWGPWDGGMVTPALAREFEREGMGLISLADGATALADEAAAAPGGPVQLVLGCGFNKVERSRAPSLAAIHNLSTEALPVLDDHRLSGRPVVPVALMLEWMAKAALESVGGALIGIDEFQLLKGVVVDGNTETVGLWVGNPRTLAPGHIVPVELRSATGRAHARAEVILGEHPALGAAKLSLDALQPYPHDPYAQLFHGPRLRVLTGVKGFGPSGISFSVKGSIDRSTWVADGRAEFEMLPHALDGAFQALILWCIGQQGAPSLPSRIAKVRIWKSGREGDLLGTARIREVRDGAVTSDVDFIDSGGELILSLEGFVCHVSKGLVQAFRGSSASASASDLQA